MRAPARHPLAAAGRCGGRPRGGRRHARHVPPGHVHVDAVLGVDRGAWGREEQGGPCASKARRG